MNHHVYAVIMAGGPGERFWPLSTPDSPKQFLRLLGGKTLLRRTVERIEPLIPIDRQIVVAGEAHVARIHEELPELPPANLICEPVGRNTAACIGLASVFLECRDPDAIAVVVPADHHIEETAAFRASLERAVTLAQEKRGTVVIGVRPDRPETGYGYMHIGPEMRQDIYPVLRFREKPDAETARRLLRQGTTFGIPGSSYGRIARFSNCSRPICLPIGRDWSRFGPPLERLRMPMSWQRSTPPWRRYRWITGC